MNPANLLKVFEIDPEEKGARMWQGLVWKLWAGQKTKDIMADLCRVEGCSLRMAYGAMKRALLPVFLADDEILDQLGLARPTTVVELARAVVGTISGTDPETDPALGIVKVRALQRERLRELADDLQRCCKTQDQITEEPDDLKSVWGKA